MLPATFADRFFPRVAHTGITAITSVTEIDMLIGSLTKDLAAAEAHKKTIEARTKAKSEKKEKERLAAGVLATAKERERGNAKEEGGGEVAQGGQEGEGREGAAGCDGVGQRGEQG